jgi:pilus assembly protein FimV
MALGLGELSLQSFLNEPLQAQVDLLNTGSLHQDEIKVRLATREDFKKMGLERAYFLTSIKFEVQIDAAGGPRIVVTSEDPVLEPYLDFIVEARWPNGRLLREYTVLVDPPVFDQVNPVISATTRVQEVEGIPAPVKKTEQPAVSKKTGTQVDIKKSTLPPGEMPDRDFSAETSQSPISGRRYMIHRDDTLWEIAQQARPQGTSVHQTMLDIQRLNPNAFIDGNINRIKAGYIVYLPSADDISSADLDAALAEVRQQNDDWRAGRASQPIASAGPTLRISADEPDDSASGADGDSVEQRDVATSTSAMEEMDKAELEGADASAKLAAMEQQVETLSRIVSLKDEQIAALQAALAKAEGGETGPDSAAMPGEEGEMAEDLVAEIAPAEGDGAMDAAPGDADGLDEGVVDLEVVEEEVVEVVVEEPVAAVAPAKPAPAPAAKPVPQESGGGMMSYLLYALGALVLGVLGFIFVRRRGGEDQGTAAAAPVKPAEDVFADVELKDQALEVEAPAEELPEAVAEQPVEEPEYERPDNRGYGERKHDEYASDVDTGDALAEADIYIAYGRYPQAIDLLNNAVTNEPGNAGYHLKLLELYAETGDRAAAQRELGELRSIGDADCLARGEEVLAELGTGAEQPVDEARRFIEPETAPEPEPEPEAEAPPLDLLADSDESLEADFSGLEIEEGEVDELAPEDLDLSADFSGSELAQEEDDEDLVIAAESSGLSTKLDLARAYMDMGDDDGARQILEEVLAEGTDELKAEASELLDRIG